MEMFTIGAMLWQKQHDDVHKAHEIQPTVSVAEWHGEIAACQLCNDELGNVMYDVSLPSYGGVWGNVCQRCFNNSGASLGQGLGQRYERDGSGKWIKTGG